MMAPTSFTSTLTPDSVCRWRVGRDGRLGPPPLIGEEVPLSYLVFLRAQPALGISFHELLGRDPDRGLYGGVNYRLLATLRVGQTLAATSEITERRQVESANGILTLTTLLTTYRSDSVVCATEAVRMVDLPAGSPKSAGQKAPREPVHPLLASFPPISRNQVAWLTVETGDMNALHLDVEYARARGFGDVVVPATLITALTERELASDAGERVVELDARYHAPTFPGEVLELHASRQGDEVSHEVFVQGKLRADGRARLQRSNA
jgi:acyl dehydratase